MNETRINRAISIWLDFPASTGSVSGVLSYSSEQQGVRFHSYGELMTLLRRLAAARAGIDNRGSASMLKRAS